MASVRHLQEELAKEDDVNEVVLRAIAVERLVDGEVDDGGLEQQRLQRVYFNLLQQRVLLMQRDMADVDRGRADLLELLLELEETVLDLLLDVVGQLLFGADELGVLRVPPLLHNPRARALERLLELVDAAVGHGQLLVLLDLFGGLWSDAVDGRARGVHLGLHGGRCLVSSLGVIDGLPVPGHMVIVRRSHRVIILIALVLVYVVRLLVALLPMALRFLHGDPSAHLHAAVALVALTGHGLIVLGLLSLYICQHLLELGRLLLV